MFHNPRYMTRGVQDTIPLEFQLFMWDDYAILLEMCGYFGVAPEEVQRLIDLGFSYDEIEMMLWEPEGVEEELTTA